MFVSGHPCDVFFIHSYDHSVAVIVVQEESRQRAYDEEKKRQEVSAKFQDTIDDVAGKLQEHYERNQELKEENRGCVGVGVSNHVFVHSVRTYGWKLCCTCMNTHRNCEMCSSANLLHW